MRELTSDAVLDAAFAWLCHQRRHYPADVDVWALRWHWAMEKRRLVRNLRSNAYRVSPNQALRKDGETLPCGAPAMPWC